MGFAGQPPYRIEWSRGTADEVAFLVPVKAEEWGVAGEVTQTAEIPYDLPLEIDGLNPNWPAGLLREEGPFRFIGVFNGKAWPRVDVGRKGKFYAGNLVTADVETLVLSIAEWDSDRIVVEVHNPTDRPITATVRTVDEMTGYKTLQQKVTLPPGGGTWLE
jgi:hypothetical protein